MSKDMLEAQNPSTESILKPPVSDYFEHLKPLIATGVDLERFSALIPDETEGLKKKVEDRYLDIFNLVRKKGIPIENVIHTDSDGHKIPTITEDMIIAILDDSTFEQLVAETKYHSPSPIISKQEGAQAEIARGLGWQILYTSVFSHSSFLGLSIFSPGEQRNVSDWAFRSAAINFGPVVVSKMQGIKPIAIKTDLAAARAKARIALADPEHPFPSEEAFLKYSEGLADSILS